VDTSVRAVVSYYGPPDLQHQFHHFETLPAISGDSLLERGFRAGVEWGFDLEFRPVGEWVPNLVGGTPDAVPDLYRLGSPITHVGPSCPPTLLLQGAHDIAGMSSAVRRLYGALRETGVPAIYVEFPDTEHGFDLFAPGWSPAAQAATYDTERFLALMV
jgi:acetyl esterase/lipase